MTPYIYIQNFRNELGGFKNPVNPIIFAYMFANKFKGEILFLNEDGVCVDVVVKIGDRYYDCNGEVSQEDIQLEEFTKIDRLSVLYDVQNYNQAKWWFLLEEKQ